MCSDERYVLRCIGFVDIDLSRSAIQMMQAADLWNRDDLTILRWINASRVGRVAIQGYVCSGFVVVLKVRRQNSSEMSLVENYDVVQTCSTN